MTAAKPPHSPTAGDLLKQGMALHKAGRLAEAVQSYRDALARDPQNAAAYPLLGVALEAMGKTAVAAQNFERAARLRPGDAGVLVQLSGLRLRQGRAAEAADIAARAIALAPKLLEARFALAAARYAGTDRAAALEANRAALAVAHETLPRLDQLAAATRRALALDPGFAEAWRTLSMMVRRTSDDAEMAAMRRLYSDPAATAEQRMHLGFALGRGFDDLGRWDEACRHFAEGNRLKRAAITFAIADRLDEMAMLGRLFSALPPLPARSPESPAPIFIVGLPRSGKTTIEHILGRHPRVAAVGEQEALGAVVREFIARHHLDRPNARLEDVPADAFAQLGRDYLARLPAAADRIVVDTMPANYRYIGFLRLALPGARVVHCLRDPLEHLVALHQKFFASAAYDYTYDWAELAAYHAAYQRLMSRWHRRFPGFVLDIDLGTLAAAPDIWIRRLLNFCGLPFDPAGLDLRNIEQRLGEPAGFAPDPSPSGRLAPYSAILSPLLAAAESAARALGAPD